MHKRMKRHEQTETDTEQDLNLQITDDDEQDANTDGFCGS